MEHGCSYGMRMSPEHLQLSIRKYGYIGISVKSLIHQRLNGTESQRIPDQVSCGRAIRYSGFFGVRSVGPVGDFLE